MSKKTQYLKDKKYNYAYFCQRNVCRLCWKITNDSVSIAKDTILAKNIEELIGISVTGHKLQSVCCICAGKVETLSNFVQFCHKADEKLDRILVDGQKKRKFEDNYHDSCFITNEVEKELKFLELNYENVDCVQDIKLSKNDEFLPNEDSYCYSCILNLESVDAKKKHDLKIHKLNSYECYTCFKRFSKFSQKLIHEMECIGSNKPSEISLRVAKKELKKKRIPTLKQSKEIKHSETKSFHNTESNEFSCQSCPETFTNESEYKSHSIQHRKEKWKCVCEVCGRVLKNKHGLEDHMKIHTGHKVKCPHCEYSATLEANITAHIRRVHIRERKFACHICPLRCFTKHNLTVHLKTHFGIKDFKCQLCPKTYTHKVALQKHIKLFHEGLVGQNKCTYCTSQYNSIEHLRKHMLKKHGIKIKVSKGSFYEIDECKTGGKCETDHGGNITETID